MRKKLYYGFSMLLVLMVLGCHRMSSERVSYTILTSSEIEVLPFIVASEGAQSFFDWKVVIDGEGTLAERITKHQADFYITDFFSFYSLHDEEQDYLEQLAILGTYTDAVLVVRKGLINSPKGQWRMGMSYGTLSDYLLDYWFADEQINRIQVRDEEQGMELLERGIIDGMVLSAVSAHTLIDSGAFEQYQSLLRDGLRLSLLIDSHRVTLNEERNSKIVHDYKQGLELMQQNISILEKFHIEPEISLAMREIDQHTPFFSQKLFHDLRYWRSIHVPYTPNWSYEKLIWLPRESLNFNEI
ncbi:hypothetical protein PVA45_00335 [Entomospira entomophila]|nr:hypothetical protein [Entomospira entomophilus]WDI35529.1 hypothetical protein PVA45_00335 [Entomospira entomophilus]